MKARTLEETAAAYAARCLEITELKRQAWAVPGCEAWDDEEVAACTDRLVREWPCEEEERGMAIRWWEATEEQLAKCCAPCVSRVALWREKHRKSRTLGGLKRALLGAYRRSLAAAEKAA